MRLKSVYKGMQSNLDGFQECYFPSEYSHKNTDLCTMYEVILLELSRDTKIQV
jgi:hypothetical protein